MHKHRKEKKKKNKPQAQIDEEVKKETVQNH